MFSNLFYNILLIKVGKNEEKFYNSDILNLRNTPNKV